MGALERNVIRESVSQWLNEGAPLACQSAEQKNMQYNPRQLLGLGIVLRRKLRALKSFTYVGMMSQ